MKFVWSVAAKKSFELLKEILISPLVLAHKTYLVHFEVYYDASSVGVGVMLAHAGRSIAHASKILIRLNRKRMSCSYLSI